MNWQDWRPLQKTALLTVCGLALALGAGCSDMVTFAGQYRDSGVELYNQGKYPDAAGAFRNAIRQDPRDYQSHYWLGLTSLQIGNYQQALVAFKSCLDTRKTTVTGENDEDTRLKALEGMAQAIVKSDDTDQEVNRLEQQARNATGTRAGQDFFVLAKVYRYRKLPDMALDYYNRACLSEPRAFGYQKEFGLYAEQLQQNQKAEQALRAAYSVNGEDVEVKAALTRLGIVPGLSLKDKGDLNKPILPKGPIPEVDMNKVKSAIGLDGGDNKPAAPAPKTGGTAAAPRD